MAFFSLMMDSLMCIDISVHFSEELQNTTWTFWISFKYSVCLVYHEIGADLTCPWNCSSVNCPAAFEPRGQMLMICWHENERERRAWVDRDRKTFWQGSPCITWHARRNWQLSKQVNKFLSSSKLALWLISLRKLWNAVHGLGCFADETYTRNFVSWGQRADHVFSSAAESITWVILLLAINISSA